MIGTLMRVGWAVIWITRQKMQWNVWDESVALCELYLLILLHWKRLQDTEYD